MKHLQINCQKVSAKYKLYTFVIKHSTKILESQKLALSKFVYRFKPTQKMNDVTKETIGGMPCYVFHSLGTNSIVFLHGGAYVNKALKQHYLFANKLAKQCSATVYFPLYPLGSSGGNAQICNSKMEAFLEALNKSAITLMGDSAGGGLALSLVHNYNAKQTAATIAKVVSICPWLDITLKNEQISNIQPNDFMLNKTELQQIGMLWKGALPDEHPIHSPLYAKLDKTLPILLLSASNDILNADAKLFYEKNKENTLTWLEFLNLHHDFVLFHTKESEFAFEKIKQFILS
jgi:acetyl esterase/lipase